MKNNECITIALAGNPNVGKSTLFNALTGLNQHTGNWPGKTVLNAKGHFTYKNKVFLLVDLPGTYSLNAASIDEEIARDFICSEEPDITLVIADATCLERNLSLILQVLNITKNVIICVNLLDEAEKKNISVDLQKLSSILNVPVAGTSARSKTGFKQLKETLYNFTSVEENKEIISGTEHSSLEFISKAKEIYHMCVCEETDKTHEFDRRLDRIVTSRTLGIPLMLVLLSVIFWITLTGANYPSELLGDMFISLGEKLNILCAKMNMPPTIQGPLMDGVYTALTWVVSVMLPPMAIFFPLFTLLEDFGYLPRVAFNMDKIFRKCRAHGKQALTMCMGFGCNAAGVIGCRIIESPRERLIAILTNNFVPCNGRFPTFFAIIAMFFITSEGGLLMSALSSLMLTAIILLGVFLTLIISKILSATVLQGIPSSFSLELPPYRKPDFKNVIVRSILDRTLFVLGRAVIVAAPAGLIIWLLADFTIEGVSLLIYCTDFLDPFGRLLGVDGVIIMALILALPANEIFIPIIIMTYMTQGTLIDYQSLEQLKYLFIENNWTWLTALSTMLLCLIHFPCGTTCLTIMKETQSVKWTALAFVIPAVTGILICFFVTSVCKLFFF
jgi:ferrous iron transport protein B